MSELWIWVAVIGYAALALFTAVVVAGLAYGKEPYPDGEGMFLCAMLGLLAGLVWPLALICVLIMRLAFKPVRR